MTRTKVTPTELSRRSSSSRAYIHRVLSGQQTPTLAWCSRALAALDLAICVDFRRIGRNGRPLRS